MLKKLYYWLHKKISSPEERGEPSSGYWSNEVRKAVLRLCNLDNGHILEVGCGEGLFLKSLIKNNPGLEVSGIEISYSQLLKAKERSAYTSVKLFQADANFLPFRNSVFDMIVCANVLINLPSEESTYKVLQELARVCKIKGKVIFDIRNDLNIFVRLKYKLAKYYDETTKDTYLQTHNLSKLKKKLQSTGLELTRTISIGFPEGRFAPVQVFEAIKA